MSNKYFAKTSDGLIPIGHSSAGWCFGLYSHERLGLTSWDFWVRYLILYDAEIVDLYERRLTLDEFWDVVMNRSRDIHWDDIPWGIERGYNSEAEFHNVNHSCRGPNNLNRRAIGDRCISHGEGTWDIIQYLDDSPILHG